MKYLTAAAALICLFSPAFNESGAQNEAWIDVSPSAEFFRVSMPNQPAAKEQTRHFGEIDAKGKLYESESEGASYAIWSLADSKYRSTQYVDGYLDERRGNKSPCRKETSKRFYATGNYSRA